MKERKAFVLVNFFNELTVSCKALLGESWKVDSHVTAGSLPPI